jgi:hypothetical protein
MTRGGRIRNRRQRTGLLRKKLKIGDQTSLICIFN